MQPRSDQELYPQPLDRKSDAQFVAPPPRHPRRCPGGVFQRRASRMSAAVRRGEQIAYPIGPRVGTGSAAEAVEMSEAMAYWTGNPCPSSRCHVVARAAFVRRV